MRVFIQSAVNGVPKSDNDYLAQTGFRALGFETLPYVTREDLSGCRPDDLIVGGIGYVAGKLKDFGIGVPDINYPEELSGYLGRKVWTTTIDKLLSDPEAFPVFVKPVREKRFTGLVLRRPEDRPELYWCEKDEPVLCSEAVDFQREWRAFVRYGRILDIRPYRGDWRCQYDVRTVEQAVADYTSAPAGYAIDFGVTDKGETLLVEVNDGFSLSGYGLLATEYAKLLSARWCELTGIHDECDTVFEKTEWRNRTISGGIK